MINFRYILIILLTTFVIACGSENTSTQSSDILTIKVDDNGSEHEVDNSNEDTDKIEKVGVVELEGPVKNATVSIQTLDGVELLQSNTDEGGQYIIDLKELSEAIQKESKTITYVRIIASNGEDTGTGDSIVKSDLSSLISVQQLTTLVTHKVNLLTTGVSEIIGNTHSVTENSINHIAFLIGVEDINQDNKINSIDLFLYSIGIHQSRAENYLRKALLSNIQQGDNSGVKSFVRQTKEQKPTVFPIIQEGESTLLVSFTDIPEGSYIQYKFFTTNNELAFNTYLKSDKLTLSKQEILYYQECSYSAECFKLQKILFDGENYFHDYLEYETPAQVIDDVVIVSLENNLLATTQEITKLEKSIKEQEAYLQLIKH